MGNIIIKSHLKTLKSEILGQNYENSPLKRITK